MASRSSQGPRGGSATGGEGRGVGAKSRCRFHKPRIAWAWAVTAAVLALASVTSAAPHTAAAPRQTLEVDNRIPYFENGGWNWLSPAEHDLRRREASWKRADEPASGASDRPTSTAKPAPTSSAKTSGSASTTGTASGSVTGSATSSLALATTTPTSFPVAFDTFKPDFLSGSACPKFIGSLMSNATFQQCYPFSSLLQSSSSLIQALKSQVTTTQVLDRSCAANVTMCQTFFTAVANDLVDTANCGLEYDRANMLVTQMYISLRAYSTVYRASCLRDNDGYCFVDSLITNTDDLQLYLLPLNYTLGDRAVPSCSDCNRRIMAIYQSASSDRRQYVAKTYSDAAEKLDVLCGPDFANTTLPEPSAAGILKGPSWMATVTFAVATSVLASLAL